MKHLLKLFIITISLICHPSLTWSKTYKYTDDNGVINFVDSLAKVPLKYRSQIDAKEGIQAAPEPALNIPQMPLKDMIARVGPGGVTKNELAVYMLKYKNEEKALEAAIEDELIFQAALSDGILNDSYIRRTITENYRSQQTTAKINPEKFTDAELEDYYRAHPEEFTEPASVKVSVLNFMHGTPKETVENTHRMALSNPKGIKEWKDGGWVKPENVPYIMQKAMKPVFDLKPGQVSKIIEGPADGMQIFWILERKESQLIPFREIKGKVKFKMIGVKQQELQTDFVSKLDKKGDNISNEELIFRSAIQAGIHREPIIRQLVISEYLSKKGINENLKNSRKREDILPQLRQRFEVKSLTSN